MTRRTYKSPKGFTLLEMILYVSITALVLSGTATLLLVTISADARTRTVQDVDISGFRIIETVNRLVKNSASIEEPTTGTESGSLILHPTEAGLDPIIIRATDGVLMIQEGGGSPIPLTPSGVGVVSIVFRNMGGATSSIKTEIVLRRETQSSRTNLQYTGTYYGTATLRK